MLTSRVRPKFRTLAALSVFAVFAVQAPAQTFSRAYSFTKIKKSGLSVWPATETSGLGSRFFLGPSWDLSGQSWDAYGDLTIPSIDFGLFTTPSYNLGRTGFQVQFGGKGKIGLDILPYYDGGTMDLSFGGYVSVSGLPSLPQPGQAISLKLKYGTSGSSYFNVSSPDMGVTIDGVFNLSGNASGSAWFLGDTLGSGKIFDPFETLNTTNILPQTKFSGETVAYMANVLNGINMADPLPVGASVSVPDLSVDGYSINTTTGALSGSQASTFLSVETDAKAWFLMFFPGAKATVGALLDGSAAVPGTGAVVGWDFAKIYADMNAKFTADYTITPTTTVGVDVYTVDANGVETLYASSNSDTLNFTMPNSRIRVRPRGTLQLSLVSQLGLGLEGEFGTSPIKLTLDGTIGTGSRAQTYHVDFDPAKLSWTTPTGAKSKFKTGQVNLGGVSQTFEGTYLALANLNDLTPRLYPGTNAGTATNSDAPVEIKAYSLDGDTEDAPRYTIYFGPEQGYTYFYRSAGSNLVAHVGPAVSGGTEASFDPVDQMITGQQGMKMQFRSTDLKPGRYSLKTQIDGTNQGGVLKHGFYLTTLNVVYDKGVIDGGFYLFSDPAFTVNRIVADGTDQTFEIFGRHLYQATEVVMNGAVVLSRSASTDNPNNLNDGQQIKVKVPAAVAKRFAGTLNTIQLRTPDLSGDGTGFILSDPKPLFIVAGKPTLSGTQYQDVANKALPLGALPVTFELDGTNLSQATTVKALWTRDGVATTTDLPTSFASETALRTTLPAEFLADFHSHSSTGKLSVQATTPKADVPADHYSGATTSGGVSTALPVTIVHLTPTIERFDAGVLVKNGGEQTFKVYGQNLLRDPSAYYAAPLKAGFRNATKVAYPTGTSLTVPYLLVTLSADNPSLTSVGQPSVSVRYADVSSKTSALNVEFGAPTINVNTTYRIIMGASGGDLTLTGGAFYDGRDSNVLLNGASYGTPTVTAMTSITAHIPATVNGATASAFVRTKAPGGGDSKTVTVKLLEGDPSKVTVVPGALVFDRATNTYRQSFAVTYVGTHDVSQGARLTFTNVPSGVTLQNSAGSLGGKPYLNAPLVPRRQTTVVAIWAKGSGSGAIDSTTTVAFPY